jgi:hypothetical protein
MMLTFFRTDGQHDQQDHTQIESTRQQLNKRKHRHLS